MAAGSVPKTGQLTVQKMAMLLGIQMAPMMASTMAAGSVPKMEQLTAQKMAIPLGTQMARLMDAMKVSRKDLTLESTMESLNGTRLVSKKGRYSES